MSSNSISTGPSHAPFANTARFHCPESSPLDAYIINDDLDPPPPFEKPVFQPEFVGNTRKKRERRHGPSALDTGRVVTAISGLIETRSELEDLVGKRVYAVAMPRNLHVLRFVINAGNDALELSEAEFRAWMEESLQLHNAVPFEVMEPLSGHSGDTFLLAKSTRQQFLLALMDDADVERLVLCRGVECKKGSGVTTRARIATKAEAAALAQRDALAAAQSEFPLPEAEGPEEEEDEIPQPELDPSESVEDFDALVGMPREDASPGAEPHPCEAAPATVPSPETKPLPAPRSKEFPPIRNMRNLVKLGEGALVGVIPTEANRAMLNTYGVPVNGNGNGNGNGPITCAVMQDGTGAFLVALDYPKSEPVPVTRETPTAFWNVVDLGEKLDL
ncbi:MAG: hypothetical protein V1760_03185 [Candidatus Peregrinibacteria bacterium]